MKVRTRRKPKAAYLLHNVFSPTGRLRAAAPLTWLALILAFPCHSPLLAQALSLSSAAAKQGDRVAIELSLALRTGVELQALQWETTIPAAQLSFVDRNLEGGPAAQAAGKSFVCALKPKVADKLTLLCLLVGGIKSIPSGVIGTMRLQILPDAPPGPAQVRTGGGLGVLKGTKEVSLPPTNTVVSIRPLSDLGLSQK